MRKAHASNRAKCLKLFGLLDHLDAAEPSPKRAAVAGKIRPSSKQFLDLGDAGRVARLVTDAAKRGDRRCFQRFGYDVEGGIDLPLVDLVDERGVESGRGIDLEGRDGDPKIIRNGFDESPQAVPGVVFPHPMSSARLSSPSGPRLLTPDLTRRFVLAQPDENRMAKQPIVRPAQIGHLRD